MGMEDYRNCDACGKQYSVCSWYAARCECGALFCSKECASKDDKETCKLCRLEIVRDNDLLAFLLKHYGLNREQAEELYRDKGHVWGTGWEDSDKLHPGFNVYGGYVDQCEKCGMYGYEYNSGTATPGKYEGQPCGDKIRDY